MATTARAAQQRPPPAVASWRGSLCFRCSIVPRAPGCCTTGKAGRGKNRAQSAARTRFFAPRDVIKFESPAFLHPPPHRGKGPPVPADRDRPCGYRGVGCLCCFKFFVFLRCILHAATLRPQQGAVLLQGLPGPGAVSVLRRAVLFAQLANGAAVAFFEHPAKIGRVGVAGARGDLFN